MNDCAHSCIDVYDFDGTLYQGDSTADFLRYCLRKYPRIAITLPLTGAAAVACLGLHAIDKTRFKAALYRFLPLLPNTQSEVESFWQENERKIAGPCSPKAGDLVISASPEFLLKDVCQKRGLQLIASKVDPVTGRVLGSNCSGEEKVVRFREAYPDAQIGQFFSDSHNDDPLAALAKEAYLVEQGKLLPWDFS